MGGMEEVKRDDFEAGFGRMTGNIEGVGGFYW